MKMCRAKLTHSETQGVINELTCYYESHRIVIISLLVVIGILTLALCYNVTHSVTQGLSARCQVLLEEQDQRFATECR
jgi:hypothetical protein